MHFDESFFEDEVRNGFYVPSIMKQAWGAQLEVLEVIKNICKRHGIKYFAAYGTALGAARHKGFVPWDDDIDIIMKRPDFEHFKAVCESEFPDGFQIHTYYNHPDFWHFLARVVNSPRISFDEEHLEKFHNFPYIAGIDLFIYDCVSDNPDEEAFRERIVELILATCDSYLAGSISDDNLENVLSQISQVTCIEIDRTLSGNDLVVFLYRIAEQLIGLFKEENCENLSLISPLSINGKSYRISKKVFKDSIVLPFENTTIEAPVGYDEYLRSHYGDYHVLVKGGGSHGYPCFAAQEQSLLALMDFELPGFIYKKENALLTLNNKLSKADIIDDSSATHNVLFVVSKASQWEYIKGYYEKECSNINSKVYVCVVPYHHKNFDGSYRDTIYEISDFPPYINLIDCRNLDIKAMNPDKIYIQNPYDEYNPSYILDPDYFSVNLAKYTNELIYVPYFTVDEFTMEDSREFYNMRYYVTVPGVIAADKVLVQSKNMKALYINKLNEFLGADYTEYFSSIIEVQH